MKCLLEQYDRESYTVKLRKLWRKGKKTVRPKAVKLYVSCNRNKCVVWQFAGESRYQRSTGYPKSSLCTDHYYNYTSTSASVSLCPWKSRKA